MGSPKRRVSPRVYAHVNRNLDTLFIKELSKVLKRMPDPWIVDPRGKPHPPKVVVACVVLKIFFVTSYDGIEAKLKVMEKLFCEAFNADRIPTHSVIHDGMGRVSMKYLRKVFRQTIYKVEKKRRVAMDSTGLSTKNSSVWYDIRIKRTNKRRDCLKLHVLVDVDTGQILAVRMTESKRHDGPVGRRMLREVWNIELATGDGAYCSRATCTAVAKKRGTPYLLPRKDATTKPKGHPAWKVMIRAWRNDEKAWKGVYHVRSFVEAVFASIKKRFGRVLLSLKKRRQRKELFLKTVCYNIKEALYTQRALELGIEKWQACKP